jgi:hypothetical protein
MRTEEMLPHTLMEVVVVVVMVIMVMRKSIAADCPLLMNVLLNTSQWGHRSPHSGSQLQFEPQKLQTTEHITSIPVNKKFPCYGPVLFPFIQRRQEEFDSLHSFKCSLLYTKARQKLQSNNQAV